MTTPASMPADTLGAAVVTMGLSFCDSDATTPAEDAQIVEAGHRLQAFAAAAKDLLLYVDLNVPAATPRPSSYSRLSALVAGEGPEPRKRTVFHFCPRHRGYFAHERRERTAETFGEGGPHYACGGGDTCKIRPGTDLWVAEMCLQRAWYDTAKGDHHFRWDANAKVDA